MCLSYITHHVSADEPALHEAAVKGDLQLVKRLLASGADPSSKMDRDYTPLHFAAAGNHYEVIDLLISKKAKVNATTSDLRNTPLHAAAQQGNYCAARALLRGGADLKKTNKLGNTPFLDAAMSKSPDTIDLLLEYGADIDQRGYKNFTAVHMAAYAGNRDVVRYLMTLGADVTLQSENGHTPRDLASAQGSRVIAEELKYPEIWRGNPPPRKDITLTEAVTRKNLSNVVSAVHWGAEINKADVTGMTALGWAAQVGDTPIVRFLLDKGADVNQKSSSALGMRPLHWAAKEGHLNIVYLLLEKKAKVNAKDTLGMTPLAYAKKGEHEAVIKLLEAHGGTD